MAVEVADSNEDSASSLIEHPSHSSSRSSISKNPDERESIELAVRTSNANRKDSAGAAASEASEKDPSQILEHLWKGDDTEESYEATMKLLHKEVDDFIRNGMGAFQRAENMERKLGGLQDELESKDTEMERLRASEEKNRTTISNLLRALEVSRNQARDSARSTLIEANLRAEVATAVSSRNEALAQAEASKRQIQLMQEENRQTKVKLSMVTQAKMQLERDQRATMSLAKNSLDANQTVSADVNYYKRKVSELTGQLHGKNAVLAEKDRQLDDLRRQVERSMSQNRLAQLRRETSKRHKVG